MSPILGVLSILAAADPPPVLAVFGVENRGATLDAAVLDRFTEYLEGRLGTTVGGYYTEKMTTTYEYDELGNIIAVRALREYVETRDGVKGTVDTRTTHELDAAGRIVKARVQETNGGKWTGSSSYDEQYIYDERGLITRVESTRPNKWALHLTYDASGLLQRMEASGTNISNVRTFTREPRKVSETVAGQGTIIRELDEKLRVARVLNGPITTTHTYAD